MPVASSGPAASTSGPYVVVDVVTCSGEQTTSPHGSLLLLCLGVEGRGAGTDEWTNDELQRPIIVVVQDGGPGRTNDELQRLVDVVVQDGGPGQMSDELQRLVDVVVQDGRPGRMSDELQRLIDVVVQDGGPGRMNDELQRLVDVVVQDVRAWL